MIRLLIGAIASASLVAGACGGEKMTAQKCEQLFARATACMMGDDLGAAGGSDELAHEMCAMPEMQEKMASSLSCLDTATCTAFTACFRADNPLVQDVQMLRHR